MSPRGSASARPAGVLEHFTRRGFDPARLGQILVAAAVAFGPCTLNAQEAGATEEGPATNAAAAIAPATAQPATAAPAAAETPVVIGSSTNGLDLNFRNTPIEQVLNYLADSAGFILQIDAPVRGTVNVRGKNLTREEAVYILNSELNKNNYTAVRKGRILRIMDKATAKTANIPVILEGDPKLVPDNDEMVTQIIPIRFVEAGQLVSDLSPFVSSQATIIANQAGNTIVVTDTQSNIRHLMEIIAAIDSSAEDVTEVKVFTLRYADPTEMATLLSGLFPDQTSAQSPMRFNRGGNRGGGRGGGGAFGGGFNPFAALAGAAAGGANPQSDRIKKRNQVVAVADARTRSVVVTATRDLMVQITEMVDRLDHEGMASTVQVIRINNADPSEILTVLQDTLGASTSTRNNRTTSPFANRVQQNLNSSSTSGFGTSGLGGSGGRGTTGGRGGGF